MLKAAFWISVIVIALPYLTGGEDGYPADYRPEPVELHEVAFMLQAAASDVLGLCDREPEVCDTGHRLMWTARNTATDLAGHAHDWLEEGPAEGDEQATQMARSY